MSWDAARLLWPLAPEDFRREHLDRQPLHLRRGRPGHYAGLFSRRALARLLWQSRGGAAELAYAHLQGRTRYLPQSQARAPLPWLQQQYRSGATVVVNSVSEASLPVARLCLSIGCWLGAPVHANAYLAPPQARGYAPHFDTDDTVFLQLEGSKRWRLWGPVVELPLLSQLAGLDPAGLGPAREIELFAGDLLYLPRGTIHTPVAGPEGSLHLTLGLHHQLWRDVLVDLLADAALRHAELQQPACPDDPEALERLLALVGADAAQAGAFERARQRLQRREARVPLPGDWA